VETGMEFLVWTHRTAMLAADSRALPERQALVRDSLHPR